MLKALLWKEWREQRAITAAGLGLALLTPALLTAWAVGSAGARDLWVAAELSAFVSAAIVWPLLAAIVGATTGGDELSRGTLRFLMSRPVSRERIWLTKTLTGALSLAAVVGFSFAVSASFSSFAGNEKLLFPFTTGLPGFAAIPNSVLRVYLAGAVVLVYVAAVFFAAFVARPMASAILGFVAAAGLCAMIVTIQRAFAYQPWDMSSSEPFAVAALAAASAIVMVAGLLAYRSGNAGDPERSRRVAVVIGASVAVAVAVAGSSALVGAAMTRIDPRRSAERVVASVPGTQTAVVTADGGDWVGSQYFVLDADGSFRSLTPRMSVAGELSADGRLFAYLTGIGTVGLRGAGCGLRVVGIDGEGDRELARFPLIRGSSGGCGTWDMGLTGMEFSPDGSRLALVADGSLFVVDTGGGVPPRRVAVVGVTHDDAAPMSGATFLARRSLRIVGWSSDGTKVVLQGRAFVATVGVEDGVVEGRVDVPEGDSLDALPNRGALIPLSYRRPVEGTDEDDVNDEQILSVFDADSGEVTEVVSAPGDTWLGGWAGTGEVIYLIGPDDDPEGGGERFRTLHRFVVATGTTRRMARFDDSAFVFMSADEGVFLVASWDRSLRAESNTWRVAVFGKGLPHDFDLPPGWRIDGWVGSDHLAVRRDPRNRPPGERVFELAISDLEGSLVTVARREY